MKKIKGMEPEQDKLSGSVVAENDAQKSGFSRYDKNNESRPPEAPLNALPRRQFLNMSIMGGLGLLLDKIAFPIQPAMAGVTDTPLSGTAAGSIPVSGAELWFDGESLGTVGSQITTWTNKGSLGTNFDLIYSNAILHAGGSLTSSAVTVENVGGKKAAYFNGSNWPTLHFRGVVANETNAAAYYYFDGDGVTHPNPLDRTIFWVYYTTTSYDTTTGFSALGTYTRYTQQSAVGFAYNNSYMVLERNDAFPTNSSTGLFAPTVSQVAQAGHRQTSGNAISFWSNRTGTLNSSYTYANSTTAPVGGASQSTDGTVKLGGMGSGRSGYPGRGYTLELIVFGRSLSDAEITSMRNYLGTKYGGAANS